MAQQKSILKLRGTIGGISFYKSKDGYLAREKGGVDASELRMIRDLREPVKMALSLVILLQPESYCVMPFGY